MSAPHSIDEGLQSVVRSIGRWPPIYLQVPRYVEVDLPFERYRIHTPYFGSWDTNVDKIFLRIYGCDIAVRMTAWGDLRDRENVAVTAMCDKYGRHEVRLAFMQSVQYEKVF